MGKLVSVFAAYLLLCCGVQYFRESKEVGPGPLLSSYIFMFAAFLLLWDIRLYPKSLRMLGIVSQCFIEFLIASFLLENIMVDFWFPLELTMLALAAKVAAFLEEMLQSGNWPCGAICEALKNEITPLILSYLLSIFFLLAVLHATRAIDLRELENGPGAFFREILNRAKRYYRRQKKYLGIGVKKKVNIREEKLKKRLSALSSSDTSTDICPVINPPRSRKAKKSKPKRKSRNPCDDDLKYTYSDFEMTLKDNN